MNGNRGAKGSVNDRIISFLYRKRYLEYLKKKEKYTKEEREKAVEYLKRIKKFDIDTNVEVLDDEDKKILEDVFNDLTVDSIFETPEKEFVKDSSIENQNGYNDVKKIITISDNKSVDELLNESDKIEEFNPFTENYDFDKYDYYEIIDNHKGLDKEKIDIDKTEKKLDDEKIILEEVTTFINDSKNTLSEIKFELNDIKDEINKMHTEEQIKELNYKFNKVKSKVEKLKNQYDIIKDKYEFEDYEILDNIKLIDSIEDYKDKASLEELELMVDACKYEIESISGISIEEEKKTGIDNEIREKRVSIKKRDTDFIKTKDKTIELDEKEELIYKEMLKEQQIISELDKKLSQITSKTEIVKEYVYDTSKMFASFLRISAGILTAPLSGIRIFHTMLGTNLINHGLKDLKTSLIPQEKIRTEIRYKYTSVEREILSTKNEVLTTSKLLDSSINELSSLKEYFKKNFESESEYIPEYNNIKKMMEELEKVLLFKKEEIKKIDQKLDKQYEENKKKVLKTQNSR